MRGLKVSLVVVSVLLSSLLGVGAALGDSSDMDVSEHVVLETGSTSEWDGGDYVAFNMTRNGTFAWFGIVYGNDTNTNGITLISAYIRFLGGAEIRDENGGIMWGATGIPVLTVYIQKLAALIEFNDTGYTQLDGNRVGAGNGVFDFKRSGLGINDFEITSVEPVYKIVDLNRSWQRSDIKETKVIGNNHSQEWEFSLWAEDVSYDKIWDNEEPTNEDGSRAGTEADGAVDRLEFVFHVSMDANRYRASVPWYRVNIASNDRIVRSEEVGVKEYEGVSLTTEFKFDHVIQGWDYTAKSETSKLMLENFVAFGAFVPDFVKSWLAVQYPDCREEPIGVAEIETFTGDEGDIDAVDKIPDQPTMLKKDSIVFKDRWRKLAELTWVDKADVDGRQEDIYYQIHAGENVDFRGENDDGEFQGLFILGGYIYPAGADIYHDPSYICSALLLNIQARSMLPTIIMLAGAVSIIAVATVMVLRRRGRRGEPTWEDALAGKAWP